MFWEKIRRGWKLGLISYEFIHKHPAILYFTGLSTVIETVLTLLFIRYMFNIQYLLFTAKNNVKFNIQLFINPHIIFWAIITTLLSMIIKTWIEVALSWYIQKLLHEDKKTVLDSYTTAFHKLPTIIAWAIINYTVGIVINQVRKTKNHLLRSLLSGIATLMTAAWSMLTFFVVPSIADTNLSIKAIIETSAFTMKKSFGENVGSRFSLGFANTLLFFVVAGMIWLLGYAAGYLLFSFYTPTTETAKIYITAAIVITILLPFIVVLPITTGTAVIFQTITYNYVHNRPLGIFTKAIIEDNFEKQS